MNFLPENVVWWITVVDIPALGAMLGMMWKWRTDTQKDTRHVERILDVRCDQLRDALAAFKLEVAKSYASQGDLRSLELRLVEHLVRIEGKLDKTALKTAELNGRNN